MSTTMAPTLAWRRSYPAYFKAGEAGPQGGSLLNGWAAKQAATQALYDVEYYQEAATFGAPDGFGNYSFDELDEMFSDS
jgi:hypothetical protein